MISGYFDIAGRKLPFRRSLGAFKKFDERFKKDGMTVLKLQSRISELEVSHIISLFYYLIEAGYKSESKPCEITIEWVEDNISLDDLPKLIEAIAPQSEEEQSGQEDDATLEKKSYKGGE